MFVDADALQTIQDVAGMLAASAVSSEEWNSTEIGRCVRFADDRSQDRVREILIVYADTDLQKRCPAASVKRQRPALITPRIPKSLTLVPRSMGLASLRDNDSNVQAHNEMVHKCKVVSKRVLFLIERQASKEKPRFFFSRMSAIFAARVGSLK